MPQAVIFVRQSGGPADEGLRRRAHDLAGEIAAADARTTIGVALVHEISIGLLASRPADVILAVTTDPSDIVELYALRAPVVWDLSLVDAEALLRDLATETAAVWRNAVAAAQSFVGVDPAVAAVIEDQFLVGITRHSVARALRYVFNQTAIVLGSGLGNMIYGASMLRWVSERIGAPVDLVIHNRFDEGVALFTGAQWINAVYPGYEFLVGRKYKTLVSSVTAGSITPPFAAERSVWLNRDHSYNEEGRFVHEMELNYLGLNGLFGDGPTVPPQLPFPFIREGGYVPPRSRVVGVANGSKPGSWAKREWPHMPVLVERLKDEGWQVRSFGLPHEFVPGAEDFTGIPMRRVIEEMSRCDFFVSYDGGICHISEAIGIPTVWLFGSTGTVKNGPVYAHGRTLLSKRSCGPCLYKIDWLRCGDPLCMSDITVEAVMRTIDEMQAEIDERGYRPTAARLNDELLVYEIDALDRPPPRELREQFLQERTAPYPSFPLFYRWMAVTLMIAGDLSGAAALVGSAVLRWPDDPVLQFLNGVVRTAHAGPTPFDPEPAHAAERQLGDPLHTLDSAQVVLEVANTGLDIRSRRFIVECGIRHLLRRKGQADALAFVRQVFDCPPLAAGLAKFLERSAQRLAMSSVPPSVQMSGLGIVLERDNSLTRMGNLLRRGVRTTFEADAQKLAAELSIGPEAVLQAAFAPFVPPPEPDGPARIIRFALGQARIAVPHFSTILCLVPHVRYKDGAPGSASNILLRHASWLAAIGLRPFVVTVGFDDVPEQVTLRDSVTFVQGHPSWSEDEWSSLLHVVDPKACLSYAGIDGVLRLPAGLREGIVRIRTDGVFDADGLVDSFSAENSWDFNPAPWFSDAAHDATADDVTATFVQPPPVLCEFQNGPLQVAVIINNSRDFARFGHLAAATPDIRYRVFSGFRGRGIGKNVDWRPLDDYFRHTGDVHVVLQFSSEAATMSAECLTALDAGRVVVVASPLARLPLLDGRAFDVPEPQRVGSWIATLRRAEGMVDRLRRTLLPGMEFASPSTLAESIAGQREG